MWEFSEGEKKAPLSRGFLLKLVFRSTTGARVRFMTALFSVLKFFLHFNRRLLVLLACTILFYDTVSIAKSFELLDSFFSWETVIDRNLNSRHVHYTPFFVGDRS